VSNLSFDTYQFGWRARHPVNAEYVGNGDFTSTGISYDDYSHMSTRTHKLAAGRLLPAPA